MGSGARADDVAAYQATLGVASTRVTTVGLGETNPVASNQSDGGRSLNRRVEVAVFANDRLKKAAASGGLQ